ncbi:MAG TPA: hypothetical protein VM253_05855 [Candidatus Limnocylindrales bacterium]|nr:hypothetical protein [Candidatus Limnocylindrales bacterium]
MDAIGVLLVIVGLAIVLGIALLGRSSGGAQGDVARLAGRVPGGIATGLVLIGIGLLLILIPGGPPAGVPANGPPD